MAAPLPRRGHVLQGHPSAARCSQPCAPRHGPATCPTVRGAPILPAGMGQSRSRKASLAQAALAGVCTDTASSWLWGRRLSVCLSVCSPVPLPSLDRLYAPHLPPSTQPSLRASLCPLPIPLSLHPSLLPSVPHSSPSIHPSTRSFLPPFSSPSLSPALELFLPPSHSIPIVSPSLCPRAAPGTVAPPW